MFTNLLSQSNSSAGMGLGGTLFMLILSIFILVGMAKTFSKAGEPGIMAFIPIVNVFIICKIAGLDTLMTIVCIFFPPMMLYAMYKFVEAYGFGFGGFLAYLFLSPVMILYMGFSPNVQYQG